MRGFVPPQHTPTHTQHHNKRTNERTNERTKQNSYAAYLYTEEGRNDIFGPRWPKLAPNAFRSLAREKEAKKRVKAALGKLDSEGWVHLETGAVACLEEEEEEVDQAKKAAAAAAAAAVALEEGRLASVEEPAGGGARVDSADLNS